MGHSKLGWTIDLEREVEEMGGLLQRRRDVGDDQPGQIALAGRHRVQQRHQL
jgi:hypothetical protein